MKPIEEKKRVDEVSRDYHKLIQNLNNPSKPKEAIIASKPPARGDLQADARLVPNVYRRVSAAAVVQPRDRRSEPSKQVVVPPPASKQNVEQPVVARVGHRVALAPSNQVNRVVAVNPGKTLDDLTVGTDTHMFSCQGGRSNQACWSCKGCCSCSSIR